MTEQNYTESAREHKKIVLELYRILIPEMMHRQHLAKETREILHQYQVSPDYRTLNACSNEILHDIRDSLEVLYLTSGQVCIQTPVPEIIR